MNKKIKLGVTGFARTGKTVFIGSLVQALLTADSWENRRGQGPLAQFTPFELGCFKCASIRDDIHTDLPQFPFRKVRDSLIDKNAGWPVPTDGISHLVLDLDYHSKGKIWDSDKTIQLELIDYPGEWLADIPMLAQVDTIKTRLDAIPTILKRFRQSVLAAAVSGKLTEDWRNQNKVEKFDALIDELDDFRGKQLESLPESWQWLQFNDVAEIASDLKKRV